MDYQFDLQRDIPQVPARDSAGAYAIEFALGYIPSYDMVIVMSVELIPTERPDVLELCFGIRSKEITNGIKVSEPDFSKDAADLFIPKENRSEVQRLITEACLYLAAHIDQEYIVMETFYGNLPDKALKKYEPIVDAMEASGYELIDRFRNEDGIDFWSFRKQV